MVIDPILSMQDPLWLEYMKFTGLSEQALQQDLERDILNTSDDWDDGKLGADEQFVVKSTHSSDDDIIAATISTLR
jgi:hypothetical protein